MRRVSAQIEIDAPPERVWEVLTDFRAYPVWNPFIPFAQGRPRKDARLEVVIHMPGGRGRKLKPKVVEAIENRALRWQGRLGLPRLFDGEHAFQIEPLDNDRSRFTQSEVLSGLLVPLLGHTMERRLRTGFDRMNRALKLRAERRPDPAPEAILSS
jgi:hypothetical protein